MSNVITSGDIEVATFYADGIIGIEVTQRTMYSGPESLSGTMGGTYEVLYTHDRLVELLAEHDGDREALAEELTKTIPE